MQTLKTAIVVVLLLTVTYSAYVALTAPTPEMPAEIGDILVEGKEFDFDMGQLDADPSALAASNLMDDASGASSFDDSMIDGGTPGVSAEPQGSTTYQITDSTTGSDAVATADPSTGPSIGPETFGVPDADGPHSLPKPDPSAPSVAADPQLSYPRTPPEFDWGALDGALASEDATGSDAVAAPGSGTSGTPGAAPAPNPALVNAIATADRQWENQQLREALGTLSLFYNDPKLTDSDREALQARLDMLAGEVIYSPRHLLEQPYRVSAGETLQTIAATYEVPWQLLANINQVKDPAAIIPGQDLKVIRGPFRAEINLQRAELTLFLDQLYAGRFPVTVGSDPAPEPGTYTVQDKQTSRTYYPLGGADIPADDPRNPYGGFWLDLGNQVCIHGSPQSGDIGTAGCIRLQAADANDVYGILSQGSAVSIMR